jgi:hypothetical protein
MRYFILLLLVSSLLPIAAQNLPIGYISYFHSDFTDKTLPKNIVNSRATILKPENGVLSMKSISDTNVAFFPPQVMLIDNNIFGEFISEIEFTSQAIADSSSGIYLIVGLRNRENYYMVRFNTHGAGFSKMYKGKITDISFDSSVCISTGKKIRMRIERNILERSILIKLQGKTLTFTDPNLVMGYFGIGSENAILTIDKLSLWAPSSIEEALTIFK